MPIFFWFISLAIIVLANFQYIFTASSKNPKGFQQHKKLKPIPKFSVIKATLFLIVFGKGRFVKLLSYIGKIDKIVETGSLGFRVAFINDIQLAKEAFRKVNVCGRPPSAILQYYAQGPHGMLTTTGMPWEENRKFCIQQLRQQGFNTKSMELHIQEEIDELFRVWCDKKGETFSPNKTFYIPILSSLWLLLAGERTSAQNKNLVELVCNLFEGIAKVATFPELLLVFCPLSPEAINRLIRMIPVFPGVKRYHNVIGQFQCYLDETILSKKSEMIVNESPRDLIEAYFKEIQKTTDSESEFYGSKGESNLKAVTFDVLAAGGDTTANTIAWSILHLIRNPDIQKIIREEVEACAGINRRPLLSDRPSCPYTQAFISEVLRYSPFAAATFPHQVTEDSNIGPYFIKKDTVVFLNIYTIHHDPLIWGDPENFRPERFLSADRKTFVKHDSLCGFSVGLRRCPGEQFALDNMFLYISSICQRFVLKPDPLLKELPQLREIKSLFNGPDIFNMVVLDRADSRRQSIANDL